MRKVTSQMVAKLAGVAQSTVSKAINNDSGIAAETREAVIRAAQRLNYRMTPRGGQYTIAVILPPPDADGGYEGYVARLLSTLCYVLYQRRFRIEIVLEDDLDILNERCVAGGISISWKRELALRWADRFSMPLIRIHAPPSSGDNVYSVNADSVSAMETVISRLWKLGHRKMAFLSPHSRDFEEKNVGGRLAGFLGALSRRGVENPDRYCLWNITSLPRNELTETVRGWISEGVTALIGVNENCNGILYEIIRNLGWKVPEDISLVVWERIGVSESFQPPLTGMKIPYEALCRTALERLEQRLGGEPIPSETRIPIVPVERKSVGRARLDRSPRG